MSRRDLHSNIKLVSHLIGAPSTAQDPTAIDLAGFDSCEIVIHIGAIPNIANSPVPSWTFKLQESDQAATGFTDVVDADDVLVESSQTPLGAPDGTTGLFLTVDAAAEDDKVYRVGFVGNKRYLKCIATPANTPGATPMSITAVLGHPALAPTSDA